MVFGNVRDAGSVPEQGFDNRPGTSRLVVDYPFDELNFSAADDIARVDRLLAGGDRHTIVWLPKFFSDTAMNDLALLVKLDWLFTGSGDRWQQSAGQFGAGRVDTGRVRCEDSGDESERHQVRDPPAAGPRRRRRLGVGSTPGS